MSAGFRLIAAMLALLAVAACGKVGPPSAPGPDNEKIFPKLYPPS